VWQEAGSTGASMLLVGLTGGIATGKSLAADYVRSTGIPVIDADRIARSVLEPGRPAHRRLVRAFDARHLSTERLLLDGGHIDRDWLASLAFDVSSRDTSSLTATDYRRLLNAATHPYILREIVRQLAYHYLRRTAIVVLDVPLLIECGLHTRVHRVLLVHIARPELQLSRLLARNPHLSPDQAQARIHVQMPLAQKLPYATDVIDNSRTPRHLCTQLRRIIGRWRACCRGRSRTRRVLDHATYVCLWIPVAFVYLALSLLDACHL
jgi:dephospho-CoA kinase